MTVWLMAPPMAPSEKVTRTSEGLSMDNLFLRLREVVQAAISDRGRQLLPHRARVGNSCKARLASAIPSDGPVLLSGLKLR